MKDRTHIGRFLSAPARKFLLQPLLKASMKSMRDNADVRSKLQGPTEGIESLLDLPDFMLDRLAEAMCQAAGDDPMAILQGKEIDNKLVQQYMLKKKDATTWFEENPATPIVSEQKMIRDGSLLVCRKALGRFDAGMFSQARNLYERATEIDPTNPTAWLGLADALTALKRVDEAALARARGQCLAAEQESLPEQESDSSSPAPPD